MAAISMFVGLLILLLPNLEFFWLSNLLILSVPDEGYSETRRAHWM
jgi:hypothetical protein